MSIAAQPAGGPKHVSVLPCSSPWLFAAWAGEGVRHPPQVASVLLGLVDAGMRWRGAAPWHCQLLCPTKQGWGTGM